MMKVLSPENLVYSHDDGPLTKTFASASLYLSRPRNAIETHAIEVNEARGKWNKEKHRH